MFDDPLFTDDPPFYDDLLFDDDPPFDNNPPLNDPFARSPSPAQIEPPLQDDRSIYFHPLINGAYTVLIPVQVDDAAY